MRVVLKPYPAYRASGLAWLDEVPAHWTLTPNRALMRKRKVLVGEHHSEHQLLSLTKAGIIVRDIDSGKGKFSADMGTCQEVRCGNLVFCLFDVPETPRTVGLSPHDGMITGAYTVFECSEPALSAYLDLFYRVMDDRKLLSPLYSGLRNTIPPTRLLSIKTPVPSTDEQHAIVRYVDYVERRVRQCVRDKQKLIGLLEEQKEVIIQRAVTRGLHSDVCMKPARAEWLGNIPEHWTVLPVRYLFRAVTRRDVRGDETKLSVTQKRGLIPTGDMEEKSTQAASFDRFQVCHPGDLVLNKYKAHLGVFWSAEQRGLVTPNYTVFRPAQPLSTKFFEILFHTPMYRSVFSMTVYGVTEGMSPLYTQDFYRILVVQPPVNEQGAIVRYVADETATHCAAIARAESEISLLREFRASLVADVVTGRLDVREASASLPSYDQDLQEEEVLAGDEEADESAQLDAALEEVDA